MLSRAIERASRFAVSICVDWKGAKEQTQAANQHLAPPASRSFDLKHLANEPVFLEDGDGFGFFAGADEARGDFELVVDGDGDPAFARAVELGDDDAVEWAGFVKFPGVVERVRAGGGIDYKEGEIRCLFILLGDGAADFSELLHEIVAGVDAACGIADEEIGVLRDGLLVCVEADGGGIGVRLSGDDGDVEAVAPALELLYGGGAEGICGGEHDGVSAVFQPQAECCGGGGVPGTIDADD